MQQSLRILMTVDAVGGVWTYALELGARLQLAGHRVVLVGMGPRPTDLQRAAAAEAELELRWGDYRLEWQDDPWGDVDRAGAWLRALEHELTPDIVHLNGFVHAALPFEAPTLVVAHSCVASWWRAVHGGQLPARYDRYVELVRRGLHAADIVVAPSHAMLGCLNAHYELPRPARVIHNGLSTRCVPGVGRAPVILAAGRLDDEAKNVRSVVAAAAMSPWPVFLAGPAPAERSDGVTWLGATPRDELLAWYRRASIFAAPARYEPFGLAILEAAQAGCALVLGDIPSLREVWGQAAVYVDPADPAALGAALARLCAQTTAREVLARRACQRAQRYSVRRMVASYKDIYTRLVWSRGAPARVRHLGTSTPIEGSSCAS